MQVDVTLYPMDSTDQIGGKKVSIPIVIGTKGKLISAANFHAGKIDLLKIVNLDYKLAWIIRALANISQNYSCAEASEKKRRPTLNQ